MNSNGKQLNIVCPQCRARYSVGATLVGQRAKCDKCGARFIVSRGHVTGDDRGDSDSAAASLLVRDEGARYDVGNMVAKGGMGAILSARDTNIRRDVAMKVMLNPARAPESSVLRFIAEAQVTGQLEHPGIVPVHELGVDAKGAVFYTMKFVQGITLKAILQGIHAGEREVIAKYPLGGLLSIFLKACDAIAFAHTKGVVHRDLKPENIMVGDYGEVLVMDWGLAKVLGGPASPEQVEHAANGDAKAADDRQPGTEGGQASASAEPAGQDSARAESAETPSSASIDSIRSDESAELLLTMDGQVMGTPVFMAPEQAQGKVDEIDARTDVYALGAVLYNILTLQPPFEGGSVREILGAVTTGAITAPTDLNQSVTGLSKRAAPEPTAKDAPDPSQGTADTPQSEMRQPRALPHCPGNRVPPALSAVTMKALALRPADRYQAVTELQHEIQAYQGGFATSAEDAGLLRQIWLLIRRHKTEFGLAAAALLLIMSVVCAAFINVNAQKTRALRAQREEARQRAVADAARQTAVAAQEAEKAEREKVERENYYNTIALASRKIDDGDFTRAEAMLWDTPARFRHWEWGWLMRLCRQDLLTLRGDDIPYLHWPQFSPDGKRVAAAGMFSHTAIIWDASTGQRLQTLTGHSGDVWTVAFSPNGKLLVTAGSTDKTARIWDVETGRELMTLDAARGGEITYAIFSPDGKRIITAGKTKSGIWDMETGQELYSLPGKAYRVDMSSDGARVTTWDLRGTRLWDANTGAKLMEFKPDAPVFPALRPDRPRFITRYQGTIKVWNTNSGQTVCTLPQHPSDARAAISLDCTRVATGSLQGGRTRVWNAATGRELWALKTGTVSLALSPDGRRLVTSHQDTTLRIWDTATSQDQMILAGHSGGVSAVVFSGDGRRLATASSDGTAKIWDARSGRELASLEVGSPVTVVAFSPDGERLATGTSDAKVKIVDAQAGSEMPVLSEHSGKVNSVVYSADGGRLATASEDRTARIWDARSGAALLTLQGESAMQAAAFSPDGGRVVTGSWDGSTKVWDAHSGRELLRLEGQRAPVRSAAFSPDGGRIVTGSFDGSAKIWDADGGGLLTDLKGHVGTVVSCAVFSADGKRLATGSQDRTIRIWDPATGREILKLDGRSGNIECVVFSPDGRQLASASGNRTPRIWDAVDWAMTRDEFRRWKIERCRRLLEKDLGGR